MQIRMQRLRAGERRSGKTIMNIHGRGRRLNNGATALLLMRVTRARNWGRREGSVPLSALNSRIAVLRKAEWRLRRYNGAQFRWTRFVTTLRPRKRKSCRAPGATCIFPPARRQRQASRNVAAQVGEDQSARFFPCPAVIYAGLSREWVSRAFASSARFERLIDMSFLSHVTSRDLETSIEERERRATLFIQSPQGV